MNYLEKYNYWCTNEIFDESTKTELNNIKNNDNEIKERFHADLEFGTAGLRGIIGAGTNRMNKYTVTKATQGLANYIIKTGNQNKGVAIGYDSRNFSPEFSMWSALCLNANGIKTYCFDSLRPTPEVSFAVRELECIAGIVITASHNPPEYNGYKVYWEDGAQIVPPVDKDIIEEVNKIQNYSEIKMMDLQEAKSKGLYNIIGKEIDDKYLSKLKKLILNPQSIQKCGKTLKIVYSPLHGTGNIPVQTILKDLGFENVYVVPEQELPDGNFPTVSYPNPEDPKAFTLALDLAKKVDADIVLATDPDADRLGVYAKDSNTGNYFPFTGNMSGLLIAEYLLSQRKEKGILPENAAILTTIVSSNLAQAIAKEYNVKLFELLTGFKYIGEKIKQFEQDNSYEFIFGFEESYGCLIGTNSRDKDAVVAVMALCEAASYYKCQGITLVEQMENIYKKYGYFKEGITSLTFKGIDGAEKIKNIMNNFRSNPPTELCGLQVLNFRDYSVNTIKNLKTNEISETGLPKSNVLYFELENSNWCCIRPSGTEPKIKFYYGVCTNNEQDSLNLLNNFKNYFENNI